MPQRARLVASQPLALRPRGGSNPVVPELVDRYPVLVYALLEAKDVRPARKPYVYTTCRYAVTVIDRAESFAAAAAAMDRVDALLDNQTGTAPTGEAILYCQREEQIDQDHIITGVNYRETGSVFRVKVQ